MEQVKMLYKSVITCIRSGSEENIITINNVSPKRLSELKSELLHYLLDFFAFERFKKTGLEYKLSYLAELDLRNLNELFMHYFTINRLNEILNIDNSLERAFCFYMFQNLLNSHREKNDIILDDGDYEIERMLLKDYLKFEEDRLNAKIINKNSFHVGYIITEKDKKTE